MSCQVLRCQNPSTATFTPPHLEEGFYEVGVCTEHKQQLDQGAPWADQGDALLMGEDMPPALSDWHFSKGIAPGIILTLETERDTKPYEVFLNAENIYQLAKTLSDQARREKN